MMKFTGLIAISIIMAGCSDRSIDEAPDPEGDAAKAPEVAERPDSGEIANDVDTDGFSSSYTDFDIEDCTILRQELEEGTSTEWQCPAANGVPIFAQEGDGRFDVDFGVDDQGFQTYGGFNDIGKRIEWRTKDGKPFAAIFRYIDASEQGRGMTVLAVETIGSDGSPGCRIAQIAGDTDDPNAKAREFADAAFGKTACAETRYIGSYAR